MKTLLSIFFLVLTISLSAQNNYESSIIASAESNAEAVKSKDFHTLLDFMHPNIISMGGGKELMQSVLESQLDAFTQQNIEIAEISFGQPSEVVQAQEELHCILPQTTTLSLDGQTFTQEVNLLAASLDEGLTWKFVDLSQYDRESLKIFLPNFNDELKISSNE